MADDKEADLEKTLYITLWFNFTIYQYSIDRPRQGMIYSSDSSTTFSVLGASDCPNPQYNNTPETKLMFENNDGYYVIIEKVSFNTLSGLWYGIDSICLTQDVINFVKSTPYKSSLIAETGCNSGQAFKYMCVTNKRSSESCSLGEYKQIVYFDITRPNQFITNAEFITDNSLVPQTKTCDPTHSPTTFQPTSTPTLTPTSHPTSVPTLNPSTIPSSKPTFSPTIIPSAAPTDPTHSPTVFPTLTPSFQPTVHPTKDTEKSTTAPMLNPSTIQSSNPTFLPTIIPSAAPTLQSTDNPTIAPALHVETTMMSTMTPTVYPITAKPTKKQPTIVAKKGTYMEHTKTTQEWSITSTFVDIVESHPDETPKSSGTVVIVLIVVVIVAAVGILVVMLCIKSYVNGKPRSVTISVERYPQMDLPICTPPGVVQPQFIFAVCEECGDRATQRGEMDGPYVCVTCSQFNKEGRFAVNSIEMYQSSLTREREGKLRISHSTLQKTEHTTTGQATTEEITRAQITTGHSSTPGTTPAQITIGNTSTSGITTEQPQTTTRQITTGHSSTPGTTPAQITIGNTSTSGITTEQPQTTTGQITTNSRQTRTPIKLYLEE
eukprot:619037_1